jgi:hypothetical protein
MIEELRGADCLRQPVAGKRLTNGVSRQPVAGSKRTIKPTGGDSRQVVAAKNALSPLIPSYSELKNFPDKTKRDTEASRNEGGLTILPGGKLDWGGFPILRAARKLIENIPADDRPAETRKLGRGLLAMETEHELRGLFEQVAGVVGRKNGNIRNVAAFWAECLTRAAEMTVKARKRNRASA